MIERYLVQASTYAADIDGVILLIGVLVGFWFLVAEGVFFWLIVKFRVRDGQRAQYITGEERAPSPARPSVCAPVAWRQRR